MKTENQKIIVLSIVLVGVIAALWWMDKNPKAVASGVGSLPAQPSPTT